MKSGGTSRRLSGFALASIISGTVPSLLFAQTPVLRPGQYEMKSEWVTALGPGRMPTQSNVYCYSAADIQNLGKNSVSGLSKGKVATQCKDLDPKQTGSTVTFASECLDSSGSTIRTTAAITYLSPESYHAVVTMKDTSGKAANPLASATLDITGKRIGDCTK